MVARPPVQFTRKNDAAQRSPFRRHRHFGLANLQLLMVGTTVHLRAEEAIVLVDQQKSSVLSKNAAFTRLTEPLN